MAYGELEDDGVAVLCLVRAAKGWKCRLSFNLFSHRAQNLYLHIVFFIDRVRSLTQGHLVSACLLEHIQVWSGLYLFQTGIERILVVTESGNIGFAVLGDFLAQVGSYALQHSIVIYLFDGELLGASLGLGEYASKTLVVVSVRMGDDNSERRGSGLGLVEVEAPSQVTVHILSFAGVNQDMLVVRGGNVTSVALAYIYEIDLQDSLLLDLGLFDVSVYITAMHLDVFTLVGSGFYGDSLICAVCHIWFDVVAKEQFLDKFHFHS